MVSFGGEGGKLTIWRDTCGGARGFDCVSVANTAWGWDCREGDGVWGDHLAGRPGSYGEESRQRRDGGSGEKGSKPIKEEN